MATVGIPVDSNADDAGKDAKEIYSSTSSIFRATGDSEVAVCGIGSARDGRSCPSPPRSARSRGSARRRGMSVRFQQAESAAPDPAVAPPPEAQQPKQRRRFLFKLLPDSPEDSGGEEDEDGLIYTGNGEVGSERGRDSDDNDEPSSEPTFLTQLRAERRFARIGLAMSALLQRAAPKRPKTAQEIISKTLRGRSSSMFLTKAPIDRIFGCEHPCEPLLCLEPRVYLPEPDEDTGPPPDLKTVMLDFYEQNADTFGWRPAGRSSITQRVDAVQLPTPNWDDPEVDDGGVWERLFQEGRAKQQQQQQQAGDAHKEPESPSRKLPPGSPARRSPEPRSPPAAAVYRALSPVSPAAFSASTPRDSSPPILRLATASAPGSPPLHPHPHPHHPDPLSGHRSPTPPAAFTAPNSPVRFHTQRISATGRDHAAGIEARSISPTRMGLRHGALSPVGFAGLGAGSEDGCGGRRGGAASLPCARGSGGDPDAFNDRVAGASTFSKAPPPLAVRAAKQQPHNPLSNAQLLAGGRTGDRRARSHNFLHRQPSRSSDGRCPTPPGMLRQPSRNAEDRARRSASNPLTITATNGGSTAAAKGSKASKRAAAAAAAPASPAPATALPLTGGAKRTLASALTATSAGNRSPQNIAATATANRTGAANAKRSAKRSESPVKRTTTAAARKSPGASAATSTSTTSAQTGLLNGNELQAAEAGKEADAASSGSAAGPTPAGADFVDTDDDEISEGASIIMPNSDGSFGEDDRSEAGTIFIDDGDEGEGDGDKGFDEGGAAGVFAVDLVTAAAAAAGPGGGSAGGPLFGGSELHSSGALRCEKVLGLKISLTRSLSEKLSGDFYGCGGATERLSGSGGGNAGAGDGDGGRGSLLQDPQEDVIENIKTMLTDIQASHSRLSPYLPSFVADSISRASRTAPQPLAAALFSVGSAVTRRMRQPSSKDSSGTNSPTVRPSAARDQASTHDDKVTAVAGGSCGAAAIAAAAAALAAAASSGRYSVSVGAASSATAADASAAAAGCGGNAPPEDAGMASLVKLAHDLEPLHRHLMRSRQRRITTAAWSTAALAAAAAAVEHVSAELAVEDSAYSSRGRANSRIRFLPFGYRRETIKLQPPPPQSPPPQLPPPLSPPLQQPPLQHSQPQNQGGGDGGGSSGEPGGDGCEGAGSEGRGLPSLLPPLMAFRSGRARSRGGDGLSACVGGGVSVGGGSRSCTPGSTVSRAISPADPHRGERWADVAGRGVRAAAGAGGGGGRAAVLLNVASPGLLCPSSRRHARAALSCDGSPHSGLSAAVATAAAAAAVPPQWSREVYRGTNHGAWSCDGSSLPRSSPRVARSVGLPSPQVVGLSSPVTARHGCLSLGDLGRSSTASHPYKPRASDGPTSPRLAPPRDDVPPR